MGGVSINPDPGMSLSRAHMVTVFMRERSGVLKLQRYIFLLKRISIKETYP